MDFKICSKCKKSLPATTEFFHKCSNCKSGLHFWCKVCRKQGYQNNSYEILIDKKYYYIKNRDKILKRQKTYNQSERGQKIKKKYHNSEKGKIAKKLADIRYRKTERGKKNRNRTSKSYYERNKLSKNMSVGVRKSIKDDKYNRHWEIFVPYTLKQLKKHIESLWSKGMTWENYSIHGWHIDHKIPISSFNITAYDCADFKKCWALDNLQPLWAEENLRKSNKLNFGEQICY